MNPIDQTLCTAFEGDRRIASGELARVAVKVKQVIDQRGQTPILIFDDATGEPIEVDFRGTAGDVVKRRAETRNEGAGAVVPAKPETDLPRSPGRPKLGVVAREVTLLPRHWDWLNSQPGGASVALRKLVEEARRVNKGRDRVRRAQEVAYRFIAVMAGNRPGFEEAARALFAGNADHFDEIVESWPADIRNHARKLAEEAFPLAARR